MERGCGVPRLGLNQSSNVLRKKPKRKQTCLYTRKRLNISVLYMYAPRYMKSEKKIEDKTLLHLYKNI